MKKLLSHALSLSESERALLAASLIDSLDPHQDSNVEAEWQHEITPRLEEIDAGKVKMISWTEARKQILEGL